MPRKPTCDCGTCRRCKHRDYMRGWYQRMTPEQRRAWIAKRDPEKVRAADRARFYRDHEKRLANGRKWRDENRARSAELARAWAERNPEKRRAHIAVGNALRDGLLERQPCEVCGTSDHVHAHHDVYSKQLNVRWLCVTHHAEHHRKYAVAEAA